MKNISDFINKVLQTKYLNSIIVIVLSIIIYKTIVYLFVKGSKNLTSNRGKTYLKMVKSIFRYVILLLTVIVLLQVNGINVSSMLAGVGIISVIIGFAVQDVLKDIIKGFNIISDKYFQVGDVIKYGNIEGKVIAIGLKTTKIEDVRTFNVISIANRNIEQVEVVSNAINTFIPVPYEVPLESAEKAMSDIVALIKQMENVDDCTYKGVSELAESSIKYMINTRCNPLLKVQMERNVLRCVLQGLAENNIQVPYNQIDVHTK